MSLLEVDDISVRFGGIVALDGLSFTIEPETICSLIGPNGAGKTTLFNVVSRIYAPTSGTIRFTGSDLLGLPASKIAAAGVTRTFQNLALFPGMTVLDNVMVGAHSWSRGGFVTSALRLPPTPGDEKRTRADAYALLERLDLVELAQHPCAGLPYGTLKRIELARALASRPRLLMLDEPSLGLAPIVTRELFERLGQINRDTGTAILVVEQNANLALDIAARGYVLEAGRIVTSGSADELKGDDAVRKAYLGY